MEFNRQNSELALKEASKSNPGAWTDHSRYVAEACSMDLELGKKRKKGIMRGVVYI